MGPVLVAGSVVVVTGPLGSVGVEQVAEHGDGGGELLGGAAPCGLPVGGDVCAVGAADPGQLGAPGVA